MMVYFSPSSDQTLLLPSYSRLHAWTIIKPISSHIYRIYLRTKVGRPMTKEIRVDGMGTLCFPSLLPSLPPTTNRPPTYRFMSYFLPTYLLTPMDHSYTLHIFQDNPPPSPYKRKYPTLLQSHPLTPKIHPNTPHPPSLYSSPQVRPPFLSLPMNAEGRLRRSCLIHIYTILGWAELRKRIE